ncbi:hypothetical protein HAX54_034102 [Datura stramonium]|uniref:3'(2'),5'-bisphosphate nucleotidase n=1 Tax=Datura stramonium TaxID=4076 RepID=A0ABS8VEQ2_DATST|nr:hypothetical protein [Datura stramonium]
MDEDCKLEVTSTNNPDGYSKELEIAVRAFVNIAVCTYTRVTPVRLDWSVQAIVSWVLSEAFGNENVCIVAEEDVEALSKASSVGLLEAVVRTVNECLADALLWTERKGGGRAWMQPLLRGENKFVWPNSAREIRVSSIDNPELATFCEPVEKANSSHSFTAGLAHSVGLRHSSRDEIYMKFARAGYKEKIWDHAAGVLIIEEAGGVVTDAGGRPLDFSKGEYLEGLDRGIIACAGANHTKRSSGCRC